MQNRKLTVGLPFLLSVMVVVGMFIGYSIRGNMPGKGIFYLDKPRPIQEVIDLINSKYVDSVNNDTLGNVAINGILSRLDPHSVYLPAEDLQMINEEISGHFYGIGIEYHMLDDTINVLNVLPGGPSSRAGLLVGDQIIKANDSPVVGVKMDQPRIKKLLRGPEGSTVTLTVLRNHIKKLFVIKREGIPIYSLDAAYMITPTTGYIRLNKFSETTYKEFMQSAEKLKKEGMKDMILDLRDNGGGILTEATDIADEFLEGDKLITYTEGVHSKKKEYRCKREGIFEKGKLLVLANEGTASASEVLIGALQDWDRATIIGRRTFGKGLVQEQYQLSDGSGLRLTVARYYTPLGRSIQKSYSAGNSVYKEELHSRYLDGELVSADSIKHTGGKSYKTPAGKTVYSFGGITPDVFVPFDTTSIDSILHKIYVKNTLYAFVYKDYMTHKDQLNQYASAVDFEKKYPDSLMSWNQFNSFAKKDSIDLNKASNKDIIEIRKQYKLMMAQQIWHTEGMYEAQNIEDPIIIKALQQIRK